MKFYWILIIVEHMVCTLYAMPHIRVCECVNIMRICIFTLACSFVTAMQMVCRSPSSAYMRGDLQMCDNPGMLVSVFENKALYNF